jgi:hypothetical protein
MYTVFILAKALQIALEVQRFVASELYLKSVSLLCFVFWNVKQRNRIQALKEFSGKGSGHPVCNYSSVKMAPCISEFD